MKNHRHIAPGLLITTLALACSSAQVQAVPDFTVAAFATGTQGENNSQDGSYGQWAGDNLSVPYGAGTIAWDGITFDAADGSTGSAHITANFSAANNTDLLVSMAPGYNNWYYEGSSASCPTGTVDFTQYHAVQFDILWDTNSTLTIDQFNTGNNWPSNYLNPGEGSNYMATNSYFTDGVNVSLFTGSGGTTAFLGNFKVPANAASGWQTVTVPYSDTLPGITSGAGLWFSGYFGGGSGINGGPYSASFWIDNLHLVGNQTVSAPPTVSGPTSATPGLNIFNAAVGTGGFPYSDRNEVVAKTTSGLSWVSNTPTTYTMNLAGFPNGAPFTGEAYLFLIPNAAYEDQAPDYNESACFVVEIQSTTNGAQSTLSYKVNNPQSETYSNITFSSVTGPSATTNLTAVPTGRVTGNYSLTFTANDAGTLTAPDGTVGSFTLPPNLAETYFAEGVAEPGQSNNFPFLLYLGGQPNDASFINKPTVYGSITVTGPPNAALASEDFVNDANTGTPLQNWGATWPGNATSTPLAVTLVPTNAPYWISWTLPASGFVLADSASLANPDFLNVSTYAPIAMYGVDMQLISKNDLVSPQADFFAMVHREFSKLLVLLPGQTNTPGVAPGYTGTPTPLALNSGQYVEETVTVIAVDSQWNPVGAGITDGITLSSATDGSALVPQNPVSMSNGSVTFDVNNPFFFGSSGSETVTATDTSNTNIAPATSAAVTVTP
jgi:hypothetical protein